MQFVQQRVALFFSSSSNLLLLLLCIGKLFIVLWSVSLKINWKFVELNLVCAWDWNFENRLCANFKRNEMKNWISIMILWMNRAFFTVSHLHVDWLFVRLKWIKRDEKPTTVAHIDDRLNDFQMEFVAREWNLFSCIAYFRAISIALAAVDWLQCCSLQFDSFFFCLSCR